MSQPASRPADPSDGAGRAPPAHWRRRVAALLLSALIPAACGAPDGGPEKAATGPAPPTVIVQRVVTHPTTPQIPPVELGKRPPNTPLTSANMPFFDTVTYCELATRGQDTIPRGPAYENCAGNQAHYRSVIGSAIDAKQFKEADVDRCAKASRTAYEGMWYCLNDQPYS